MSMINLAAQRSYILNEPVWFSWRRPSLKKILCVSLLWIVGMVMMLTAGLYAHIYWNLRHPAPDPIKTSVAKTETQLSDMHYVYISKPFPHPELTPEPAQKAMPPLQEMPINTDDADWQQAPDGEMSHDMSRDTLPGAGGNITSETEEPDTGQATDNGAIKALLMQALKEQENDYSQGKVPAPPVDETAAGTQANNSVRRGHSPFS